jgi:TolB protein
MNRNSGEQGQKFALSFFALTIALAFGCRVAFAQPVKMTIVGPGSQLSAIAVSSLKDLNGDTDHRLSAAFVRTLRRNLELSGYFRIIDPHAYIEDAESSGYELGQFNFGNWRTINANFLVKGAVTADSSGIKLAAYLYDVAQERRTMGKNYSGDASDIGRIARKFADAILEATTGQNGPFDAKLAFVSTRGGRFKEIYTQSIDGDDVVQQTDNPTINLFPAFDHSARRLLYTSYKWFTDGAYEPALYVADTSERVESRIISQRGRIAGGTITPDGSKVVAAIEHDGITNLYLMSRAGAEIAQLTNTRGINVGPAVSPDGGLVAFASDRSGSPQIWMMPLGGGGAKRVTYSGDYNTTPSFSPDGRTVAYQSRSGGRFDICTISLSGGEPVKLTDGVGSSEHPAWSPDGRYIAFSSTRGGHSRIYVLMASSRKIIGPLTEGKGDDTSPSWSWWLGE